MSLISELNEEVKEKAVEVAEDIELTMMGLVVGNIAVKETDCGLKPKNIVED